MRLDLATWQAIGIVSGSLLAVLTLAGLLWRKVVQPVWRALRKLAKDLQALADDLAGDKEKKIPSMRQRVDDLSVQVSEMSGQMAAHLQWHAAPGGRPAKPDPPRPNRAGHR